LEGDLKICSYEGCGKKAHCKGLCPAHYQQQRHGKELKPLQVQYHGFTEPKRFLMRVDVRGKDECWPWTGSRNLARGKPWYGQWTPAGDMAPELTHRAAYRLFVGLIPDGQFVLHKCDNPVCVNPAHLFLGSQADNVKDMWTKKRGNPGTSRGEKHGMSKLTAEIVEEIRKSTSHGTELAAKYGVSRVTISEIRTRKTWRHV
jgi:hypothetical protein